MPRLSVETTAELGVSRAAEVRAFLERAFEGDFSADDWEHACGGWHCLVRDDTEEGERLVAHGALVPRTMWQGERTLKVGYVEAIAVGAGSRRQGHGDRVMARIEEIGAAYDLLALSASAAGAMLYAARGWSRWQGRTLVRSATGLRRTEAEDRSVHVLATGAALPVDPAGDLVCDWREGEVW